MPVRSGVDLRTANTVLARRDEESGRAAPIPLVGVDLVREAGQEEAR